MATHAPTTGAPAGASLSPSLTDTIDALSIPVRYTLALLRATLDMESGRDRNMLIDLAAETLAPAEAALDAHAEAR